MENKGPNKKTNGMLSWFKMSEFIFPLTMRLIFAIVSSVITTTVFALLVTIILLYDNLVPVPQFAAKAISKQLSHGTFGLYFEEARIFVSLNSNWHPRLTFDGLRMKNAIGEKPIELTRVDAIFSIPKAIGGELNISELHMDGLAVGIMRDQHGGVKAQIGSMPQEMGDVAKPSDLKLQFDRVFQLPFLESFKTLSVQNVTIDYSDGRSLRRWIVDGGRLHVFKRENQLSIRSDLALLTGGAGVSIIEANYRGEVGRKKADFGLKFSDLPADIIATQSSGFAWLAAFDAPLSGALRGTLDEDGTLGPLKSTLDFAGGVLRPGSGSKALQFSSVKTYFTYNPFLQTLEFDNISLKSKDLSFSAHGQAFAETDYKGKSSLIGQFKVNDILASPTALFEKAKKIDLATLNFRLFLDPFEIQIERVHIFDKTHKLDARGAARLAIENSGWDISMEAEIEGLNHGSLLYYWPKTFRPNERDWLENNLASANLSNIFFNFNQKPEVRKNSSLIFSFNNAVFKVSNDFPVIEKARGLFSVLNHRLTISFDDGQLGVSNFEKVDISGSEFIILDTGKQPSPAYLKVVGAGSLKSVLDLPGYFSTSEFGRLVENVDMFDGLVQFQATFDFPLEKELKPVDVVYHAKGVVHDFSISQIPKIAKVTAKNISFDLTPEDLSFHGVVVALDTNFEVEYIYDFGSKTAFLNAEFAVDKNLIDNFKIPLSSEILSGKSKASARLVFPKDNEASINIFSDLKGLELSIPQLNWEKSPGTSGSFVATGIFKDSPKLDVISLYANGLRMKAVPLVTTDEGLVGFEIKNFKIDKSIDVTGVINPNKKLIIKSGYFDARPFFLPKVQKKSDVLRKTIAKVQLDGVRLTKSALLTNFIGDLKFGQNLSGKFTADIGEGAKLSGEFEPEFSETAVRIKSNHGGAILKEFGAVKNASGGVLVASLTPAKDENATNVYLRVDNVKIQGAPLLAELLNAISIIGLIESLSGPGILFNEIEAAFRIKEEQIILKEFSAFGPSMGITLDGYYDTKHKTLDMQGVISPIYVLNAVGSIVSKKGEGLIGFNFNLTGKANNANLSVQPLSILTPAIFRNIFRRPPPQYD